MRKFEKRGLSAAVRSVIFAIMNAAAATTFLSVEDYLAGEEQSEVRHEYVGGVPFAMAGGSANHNLIALAMASALRAHLRGGKCRVFMADVKVQLPDEDTFYYPDVMVSCDSRDTQPYFCKYPKVLIEVLSDATERTDRTEKFWNYTQIETFEEYVLAAQDEMQVTVFARANNWRPEIFSRAEEMVALRSLDFQMKVAEIYEGVSLKQV
jgi:Uma2 family endonuclease